MKVVQEINAKKGTVKAISDEYSIARPIVSRWVSEYRRYGKKAFTGKGKRQPDKADFYILEQENKKLKEENDILKKFEVFVQRKN